MENSAYFCWLLLIQMPFLLLYSSGQGDDTTQQAADDDRIYSGRSKGEYEEVVALLTEYRKEVMKSTARAYKDPSIGDPHDKGDRGTENRDIGNPGTEDPGAGDPDTEDPGTGDFGPGDPGTEDPGAGDRGAGDPGTGDPDTEDHGAGDRGAGDPGTGDPDTEDHGAGDRGAGDPGTGDPDTEDHGAGDRGAGDPGTGDPDTEDHGAGDRGAGDPGTGDPDTEDRGAGDPGIGDPSAIGDMLLTPDQARVLLLNVRNQLETKSAIIDLERTNSKWPTDIHYGIDAVYTDSEVKQIQKAFQWWADDTCLTFTNKSLAELETLDQTYLYVTKNTDYVAHDRLKCGSLVGRYDPEGDGTHRQTINISVSCMGSVYGHIAHEIGHALGLINEHQRPDRDQYVTIVHDKVSMRLVAEFKKWDAKHVQTKPYDYASIMQYNHAIFARSPSEQVELIRPPHPWLRFTMGQASELSFWDVKTINQVYCSDRCSNEMTCENQGYQDPNQCDRCICPDIYSGKSCEELTTTGSDSCDPLSGQLPMLTDNRTVCIKSPRLKFRAQYAPGMNCTWFITVPERCRTHIWVTRDERRPNILQDRYTGVCNDWLEVRPQGPAQINGHRMCGDIADHRETPVHYYFADDPLVANASLIPVSFRSFPTAEQYNAHGYGFELCYKLEDLACLTLCYHKPCLNNGTCTERGDEYACTCKSGFTGRNCETNLDDCASGTCQNKGTCVDKVEEYECHCALGFVGVHCEVPMTVQTYTQVIKDGPFEIGGDMVLVHGLNESGIVYQWEFTPKGSQSSVMLGQHQVLAKTKLSLKDSGVYRCTVSKNDQTTETTFTVDVVAASSTSMYKSCADWMVVLIVVWWYFWHCNRSYV